MPVFGLRPVLEAQRLGFSDLLGYERLDYVLPWAFIPGVIPFMLVALITHALHRMDRQAIKASWGASLKQIAGASVALAAGLAIVWLMRVSDLNDAAMPSMLTAMAASIAGAAGSAFPVFSPFIGVLGSFVSGSNTVSNVLFASLQFETAELLEMPEIVIVALQNAGGAIGNMVCVNNVVAVCATVGIMGGEGRIIRRNAAPCLLYGLAVALIGAALVFFSVQPLAN
jgi:lactate permease